MKTKVLMTIALGFLLASCNASPNQASQSDTTKSESAKPQNINQEKALEMMKDTQVIVLDVRTPGEVEEGVIDGADLFINLNGGNFESEIAKLDKSKSYIVYCRSGGRSATASQIMTQNGFQNIYNLSGGISSWTGPKK